MNRRTAISSRYGNPSISQAICRLPTLCVRDGQRTAAIINFIQSVNLNGHDLYAYLKDVLTRLPTHKNRQIAVVQPPSLAAC
ncbi:hypothetical protein Pnap_4451 (plasmid) [Polaromonas naphthalenivorans CJ2]|uniref:Transposase IS66 C-terminal domain-containing protein n=1 Tax=Polaromonas naphthalenivorans (strain CJ2) TaxID=365044 RepID=A1VVP9_POLNA|nr:hypothetical protein Pnap_4451 [Polaromonas naphthalenivorans CJ2]